MLIISAWKANYVSEWTSGFWPRVRARALRALVFLGALPCPPAHRSFAAPPKIKKLTIKQNVFLQAQTRAARGIYFFTGLRCTLLSYAAFKWAMLHPIWALLHPKSYVTPSELSCTLPSYAAPFWAMLHPTWATLRPKSYTALSEQSCNFLSYAEPFWATLHPSELQWPHTELCHLKWATRYAAPLKCNVSHPYSCADPYVEINYIQRKPRENSSLAKSAKVYHNLYSSIEQLQVALWTYMVLKFGLNNDKSIHTLPLRSVPFLSLHL